jgi:choline dehydrogenase-like flavoprotein
VNKSTGEVSNVTAKKEIIIAAGAVHSPQILQLSGVRDMSVLEMLGIEVVVDLPGAGQNFQDHLTLKVDYNCEFSEIYQRANILILNCSHIQPLPQRRLLRLQRNMQYRTTRPL